MMTMMNSTVHHFPAEHGLLVQEADLKRWRRVLNDKAFALLQQECIHRNADLTSDPLAGYDVFRGDDMLQFIINQSYMLK